MGLVRVVRVLWVSINICLDNRREGAICCMRSPSAWLCLVLPPPPHPCSASERPPSPHREIVGLRGSRWRRTEAPPSNVYAFPKGEHPAHKTLPQSRSRITRPSLSSLPRNSHLRLSISDYHDLAQLTTVVASRVAHRVQRQRPTLTAASSRRREPHRQASSEQQQGQTLRRRTGAGGCPPRVHVGQRASDTSVSPRRGRHAPAQGAAH